MPTAYVLCLPMRRPEPTVPASTLTTTSRRYTYYIYIRWWDISDVNRYRKSLLFMLIFLSKPFLSLSRIITHPSVKTKLRAKKTSIFCFSNLRECLITLALPNFWKIPSHCRGRQFEPDCPYRLYKGFSGNLLIFMGNPD